MSASTRLDPDLTQHLAGVEEIVLETTRKDGRSRRTALWVVVVDGRAYVRSWHGARGAWYRDLMRQPTAVLHAQGTATPVRTVREEDPGAVEQVSQGYLAKYNFSPYTRTYSPQMVLPETLPTTTRLEPR
jgi:hypothetical protein